MKITVLARILGFCEHIFDPENPNVLLKAAFQSQLDNRSKLPKSSWINSLKKCLNGNGLGNIWQSVMNGHVSGSDVSEFSQRLKDIFEQEWFSSLHNDIRKRQNQKNKLRCYRQFKTQFGFEKYLSMSLPVIDRVHLTKLRISNHKLGIETGRYFSIPVDKRVCPSCGQIDDEIHFLFNCNLFDTDRQSFFRKVDAPFLSNLNLRNEIKLSMLLSSDRESIIIPLASFVTKAFKSRNIDLQYLPKYF